MKSANILAVATAFTGLSLTATCASAQAIYVDPYAPVVAPEAGYVVRQTVVAPAPIVRERMIVVRRPAYVRVAPVVPVPSYGYTDGYVVSDW
jgi:hypothetical protein